MEQTYYIFDGSKHAWAEADAPWVTDDIEKIKIEFASSCANPEELASITAKMPEDTLLAYLDLAYSDASEEIGLSWAGYVDERKTFALNPNDYKGDIIGVQAQLWSSQLRSFDDATYQMLPKALGMAERGCNGGYLEPFETAFNRFYSIIVAQEMSEWEQKGYAFKKR